MEFTQEELDELEAYLQTHPPNAPSKSSIPHENNNEEEEIEKELEKFLDEMSRSPSANTIPQPQNTLWDPEAVYYDLQGNIIYQPPKHIQTDLSALFESTMNIASTTCTPYYNGSPMTHYQESIPICR